MISNPLQKNDFILQFSLTAIAEEDWQIRQGKKKKTFKSLKPIFRMKRLLSWGLFKEHLDTFDKAPRHSRGIRGDGKGQDQTLNKSDIA